MIMHIKELGHDIGLHFDETNYALPSAYDERNEKIKELIIHEKNVMEKIIPGIKIESVSMHMPSKQTLEQIYILKITSSIHTATSFLKNTNIFQTVICIGEKTYMKQLLLANMTIYIF